MMKRKIALVLAAFMISTTGIVVANAQTRSTEDTYFNFTVTPFDFDTIDIRTKETDTPVYLWYNTATNARNNYLYVRVYGKNNFDDNDNDNVTVNGDHASVTQVRAYLGRKHSIRNNVNEAGHPLATLGFKSANYFEAQTAGGEWSPDSWGSYELAY